MTEKVVMDLGNLDNKKYAPPLDDHYQGLLMKVHEGTIAVHTVIVETSMVSVVRSFEDYRPENTTDGQKNLELIRSIWLSEESMQPWLWVKDGRYIVSDDYLWLAVIEQERPEHFSAIVLGDPLERGLREKIGPYSADEARNLLIMGSVITT